MSSGAGPFFDVTSLGTHSGSGRPEGLMVLSLIFDERSSSLMRANKAL